MKCRKCGYELWNLREPRCPECREGFDVNDWWFENGTVQFHCHECDAKLPQTKPWPWPPRCPKCDEWIDWSCVRVMPLVEDRDGIANLKRKWEGLPPVRFGLLALWLLLLMYCLPLTMSDRAPGWSASARVVAGTAVVLALWLGVCIAGRLMAPAGRPLLATIVWVVVFLIGARLIYATLQ